MKPVVIWVFSLLMGASLMVQIRGQRPDLEDARTLFGESMETSGQIADLLFKEKEKSIPVLISFFDNDRPYVGFLGSLATISDKQDGGPVTKRDLEKIEEYKKKLDHREDQAKWIASFAPSGLQKDAALYLLVAVLKDDLYHAKRLKPKYTSKLKYNAARGEIAIAYNKCQLAHKALEWATVRAILTKYQVRFD